MIEVLLRALYERWKFSQREDDNCLQSPQKPLWFLSLPFFLLRILLILKALSGFSFKLKYHGPGRMPEFMNYFLSYMVVQFEYEEIISESDSRVLRKQVWVDTTDTTIIPQSFAFKLYK